MTRSRPQARQRLVRASVGAGAVLLLAAWVWTSTRASRPADEISGSQQANDVRGARTGSSAWAGSGDAKIDAAITLLLDSDLQEDLPGALELLKGLRPIDPRSSIEIAFELLLSDPSPENLKAFLAVTVSEFRTRQTAYAFKPPADRAEAAETSRQLMLRMLMAVAYAEAGGQLDKSQSFGAIWEVGVAFGSQASYEADRGTMDVRDMKDAALNLMELRLEQGLDDEARWAAIPEDQVNENELTIDAGARHWTRAMLDLAMERAAQEGRADDVERFARRYLALPYGGVEWERRVLRETQEKQVQVARALVRERRDGAGGDRSR